MGTLREQYSARLRRQPRERGGGCTGHGNTVDLVRTLAPCAYGDRLDPPLLDMSGTVSEDAVRRAMSRIEESAGMARRRW